MCIDIKTNIYIFSFNIEIETASFVTLLTKSNPFCDKTVMEMGNPKKGILSGNIAVSTYVRSYDKLSYTTYQDTVYCVLL